MTCNARYDFGCTLLGVLAFALLAPLRLSAAEIGFDDRAGSTGCNFYLIGRISAGDDNKFREAVLRAFESGCKPNGLDIFSQGGDVEAAMAIGRQVAMLAMNTRAPQAYNVASGSWTCNIRGELVQSYDSLTKQGSRDCICASACFFIWAGGVVRSGNVVIIHRPHFEQKSYSALSVTEARQRYQMLTSAVQKYLTSVDISEALITRMLAINSRDGSLLQAEELKGLRRRGYYDELLIAKCGKSEAEFEAEADEAMKGFKGKTTADYFLTRVEASRERINCTTAALREISEQAKVEYLQIYGRGMNSR